MNPQQPNPGYQPQAPPSQQNPYDFIMSNGPQQPPGKLNLPAGKSTLQRVLIFGGGLFVLIIAGAIFMSLIFGGSNKNDQLLTIAQEQTELVRVAGIAENEPAVRLATTQNLASNVSIGVAASKNEIVPFIKSKKLDKQLVLTKNAATDKLLTSAAANNQFDDTFVTTIKKQLTDYQANLQKQFNATKDAKQKAVLKKAYDSATLLLKQSSK